jgi:ribosomal protein L29
MASKAAAKSSASAAAPTMTSVQQLEMKRRILLSVQKLSDRDCAETAVLELREAAQQLDGEQFALMLHTLTEGLGNPHYAKMAFTRRLIIHVVGELGAEHMHRLTRRHCAKLCTTIFKHVDDADSNVREACADAFASLAQSYSAVLPKTSSAAGRGTSPSAGSRLSLFLQCVFDSLSAKAQGKTAQVGAALCLARMIARVGAVHVTPALPRLCQRIEQHLNNKSCAARTELLQALANIAEVSREDLFPHAPFTAVLKCLHSSSFDTRIAAADVLATCALRLGDSMVGLAPMVVQELEGKRFDSVKPVRDAVLEAIDAFAPLMPPPEEAAEEARTVGAETAPAAAAPPAAAAVAEGREGTPGRSSSRSRQQLTFTSPGADSSPGAGTGGVDYDDDSDTDNSDLGTSRGAQFEGEIRGWAAAEEGRKKKKRSSTKRNRAARRVPLNAQQPNLKFFQQQDPEALLEQAQRQLEESSAAAAAAAAASGAPDASPAVSASRDHHGAANADVARRRGSPTVQQMASRENHAPEATTAALPDVPVDARPDRARYAEVTDDLPRQDSFSGASSLAGNDHDSATTGAGGNSTESRSEYHRRATRNEEPPSCAGSVDTSGGQQDDDADAAVRWGAKRSPATDPRMAWGAVLERRSMPTDGEASARADDGGGGGGGIFDESFDTDYATDAGFSHTADAVSQKNDRGADKAHSTGGTGSRPREAPAAAGMMKPASYFETEMLSDSPLPLRDPSQAQAQVSRVEFNEIAVQLRQISEQQQQLVELIESSYGSLDDRMATVESSVRNINSHLGLG